MTKRLSLVALTVLFVFVLAGGSHLKNIQILNIAHAQSGDGGTGGGGDGPGGQGGGVSGGNSADGGTGGGGDGPGGQGGGVGNGAGSSGAGPASTSGGDSGSPGGEGGNGNGVGTGSWAMCGAYDPGDPLTINYVYSATNPPKNGVQVKVIQKFLNSVGRTVASSGPGSPGNETEHYGFRTANAVARMQSQGPFGNYNPVPYPSNDGYDNVGPCTRYVMNHLMSASLKAEAGALIAAEAGTQTTATTNTTTNTTTTTSTVTGCAPGANFSGTTGQPCTSVTTSTVPGCAPGANFSGTTGQLCTTAITTTTTSNAVAGVCGQQSINGIGAYCATGNNIVDSAGTPITAPGRQASGSYQWFCPGSGVDLAGTRGINKFCFYTPPTTATKGACGSANGATYTSTVAPAANLSCSPGAPIYATAQLTNGVTTSWHWYCSTDSGTTLSPLCYSYVSAPVTATTLAGACGTANGSTLPSEPTAGLCSSSPTGQSVISKTSQTANGVMSYHWYCSNNGVLSPLCYSYVSAPATATSVAGACGSSNGGTFTSPSTPTSLCSTGSGTLTPQYSGSTLTGWQWYCNNSGTLSPLCYAYNSAPSAVPGTCGSSNGGTFTTTAAPTNLCSTGSGAPTAQYDSTGNVVGWHWYCNNSGTLSPLCFSYVSVPAATPGVCGSSNGVTYTAPSTPANLCSTGSGTLTPQYSGSTLTGWQWYCSNSGTLSRLCYAYNQASIASPGACGSSQGATLASMPSTPSQQCSAGTVGAGQPAAQYDSAGNLTAWQWYCYGSTGTMSPLCFAYKQTITAMAPANANNALAGVAAALPSSSGSVQGASSFSHVWNQNLQIGSPYVADVTALQTALTHEGVYAGEVTGGFYNQTFSAVQAFQQKYGIESTGYVGPITRAKLNALY